MLMSRTQTQAGSGVPKFALDVWETVEEGLNEVVKNIVWVKDFYEEVDTVEIHAQSLNVGRPIDPDKCLSKLFVLPEIQKDDGGVEIRFLITIAHQIADGLSILNWFGDFLRILNQPEDAIRREIEFGMGVDNLRKRLPPAQEDLYPKVRGSAARQRWFWAIARVLRYVRRPLPSIINPLFREQRLPSALIPPPVFNKIFDYSDAVAPPINTGYVTAVLSPTASAKTISLCRSINVSVGAGCFALAGLVMTKIYEERYPDILIEKRLPVTATFPVNLRALLDVNLPPDSCMLMGVTAGIVLNYVPSSLPLEARFRLVAKQANRGLRMYQKRLNGLKMSDGSLDSLVTGQIFTTAYLTQIERANALLPEQQKWGIGPQGKLAPRALQSIATCMVSSPGPMGVFLAPDRYDLEMVGIRDTEGTIKDFAADFRDIRVGVRSKKDHFAIGTVTDQRGTVGFGVSYDANAISEMAADRWKDAIEGLLEHGGKAKL